MVLGLWVAAAVAAVAYAVLFAVLAVATRPSPAHAGPRTLDPPGGEPPAVVGFLANAWGVPRSAVPATLLDLAARGMVEVQHLGPGEFTVRLRGGGGGAAAGPLTAYEKRVLDLVRSLERNGEVPGDALTTGSEDRAEQWWKSFSSEVVADARARGLTRPRWSGSLLVLLTCAAVVPSVLAASALSVKPLPGGDSLGWQGFLGVSFLLTCMLLAPVGWLRAERDTPLGLSVAGRWLGLRDQLADDESFAEQPPGGVAVWGRLLAFGAAFGVARGVLREMPMGAESPTEAWSPYGGRWHVVRVRYPRYVPPGWGGGPVRTSLLGLAFVAVVAFFAVVMGPALVDQAGEQVAVWRAVAGVLLAGLGMVGLYGAARLALGLSDLGRGRGVEGRVVRMRPGPSSNNQAPTATYVAVDDGVSGAVDAFLVDNGKLAGIGVGDEVRLVATPRLGWVRSVEALTA